MDISSLRERRMPSEVTVSELNSYIKHIFDNDRTLCAISVRGEISNLTLHRSGHIYFSLKDDGSQIKAVMFRSAAASLKFIPENGMKVIARCSVSVYEVSGVYQLYVTSMQPDGIGALYLAYEQLKAKLDAEGLFSQESKKPIPKYPLKIGVITSPTGAAIRDIINVLGRRFPLATVYLYPSLVQGDGAEENLITGLEYFEKSHLADVIIIGRGGGSIEDLWSFNGERLARKIYECKTPIISAVGHETDFTICDFVSDMRAPTPSAAAEIAVPDIRDLLISLDNAYDRCVKALCRISERKEEKLLSIKNKAIFRSADGLFESRLDALEKIQFSLKGAISCIIDNCDKSLAIAAGKANALSPLATLARGYSVISNDRGGICGIEDVGIGESVKIRISDGELLAEIKDKVEL